MMNRTKIAWNVNELGEIEFAGRDRRAAASYGADSKWEHPVAAIVIMVLCAALDMVMFMQLFGSFLVDSVLLQAFSVIGMLVGFDVAPIYLGIMYRKYKQGFNVNKMMMLLAIGAFAVGFFSNIMLRIEMRDLVLPNIEAITTSTMSAGTGEAAGNPHAMAYAIFASMLPVITSIVSFIISYITSNPIKAKLHDLRLRQVELEEELIRREAMLREYPEQEEFRRRLEDYDMEQYRQTDSMIDETAVQYCDHVRERIKEYLLDPVASNVLSQGSREKIMEGLERIAQYREQLRG